MQQLKQLMTFILPKDVLEWFEVTDSTLEKNELHVMLMEKNNPPLTPELEGKHLESKGFKNITVTDFPIRGRRVQLTFRRRYWKVEGEKELLKRDIRLCAPGTQLETAFADFLKGASAETRELFDEYC